ncbi:MAG TPA: molybdenum cofactor guanylyltransferase [Pyrinomonadaceae bacterium]
MTDLEAFILIGGRSSRFGRDKAFVEFEGETLAARAGRTVEAAFPGIRITFVAAEDGQFGEMVDELDHPVIFDTRKGFSAWSGLHSALSNSSAEWTLVFACDLPFVKSELLRLLASDRDSDWDAVVSKEADGRLQPLCSIYRTKTTLALVESRLNADKSLPPLTGLFQQLRTKVVEVNDDDLRNVNTAADLT